MGWTLVFGECVGERGVIWKWGLRDCGSGGTAKRCWKLKLPLIPLKLRFLSVQREDQSLSPAQQYPAGQTGAGATSKEGLGPQPVCDGLAETHLIGRGRWFCCVCPERAVGEKGEPGVSVL